DLARSLVNLGQVEGSRKQVAKEEAHYRRAISVLGKARPAPLDWLQTMVDAQHNLIAVLLDGKQWAKGAEALREAIRYQEEAAAAAPKDLGQLARLANYRVELLATLVQLKDPVAAGKCAEEYLALLGRWKKGEWREPFRAAGLAARCAVMVTEDAKLPGAQLKKAAQAHGDRAMTLLRAAVARGLRNAGLIRDAADLQPLRSHDDFKKLLRELSGK